MHMRRMSAAASEPEEISAKDCRGNCDDFQEAWIAAELDRD